MAKTISFINMKGGVGKTTLAVNVAYTLAKIESKKVLLIDMDPQMNSTQYTLSTEQMEEILENDNKSIYGCLSPENKTNSVLKDSKNVESVNCIFNVDKTFDIIPSSLNIMNLNLSQTPFKLRQYIQENLDDNYDIILIDCPPTISEYTKISLLASESYLVPMKADPLSVFGLPMLENYVNETINGEFQHNIELLGIVLNMVDQRLNIYKKNQPFIKRKWPNKLFMNELSQRQEIVKGLDPSLSNNKYILEMQNSDIVEQIKNITKEMISKGRLF